MKAPETQGASDEEEEEKFDKSEQSEEPKDKAGRIIWRVVNGFMTAFFLMAAGVQFNDPDPYLWVPLYGTAAVLTLCISILPTTPDLKWWRITYWVHAAFCAGMFLYVVVELVLATQDPTSDGALNPLTYEEGRELAGILITSIWLFTCKQSPAIKAVQQNRLRYVITTTAIILFSILPFFLWIICYTNLIDSPYFTLCVDFMTGRHYEEFHAL